MKTHICENCKFYEHSANILGGLAKCRKQIKVLKTFWTNEACNEYEFTQEDKLKEQYNFYKTYLGVKWNQKNVGKK